MHVLYETLPLKPNKLVYPLSSLPVACCGTHLQCPLLQKHNILLLVIIILIPCSAIQMYSLYKDPSGDVNLDFSNITNNLSGTHNKSSKVARFY